MNKRKRASFDPSGYSNYELSTLFEEYLTIAEEDPESVDSYLDVIYDEMLRRNMTAKRARIRGKQPNRLSHRKRKAVMNRHRANTRRRAGRPGYEFNEEDNRWVPEGSPTFSEWLEDNGYSTSEANDELRQDYDNDTSAAVARHEFLTNGYQSSDQYWDYDTDDFISDDDDDFSWDAIYKALEDEYDVDTIDEIASDHKDAIDNALYGDSPQNAIIDIVRKNANRRKAAMNNRRPRTSNTRRRSSFDPNEAASWLTDQYSEDQLRDYFFGPEQPYSDTWSDIYNDLIDGYGWYHYVSDWEEQQNATIDTIFPGERKLANRKATTNRRSHSQSRKRQMRRPHRANTRRTANEQYEDYLKTLDNTDLLVEVKNIESQGSPAAQEQLFEFILNKMSSRNPRKATMNNRRAVIARKRAIATRKRELQMDRAIDAMTKAASALVAATNKIANDPEGTVVQDGNESETTRTEHDQDGGLNVTDTQPVTEAEAKSEEVDGTPTIDTVAVSSRRPIKMASSSASNDLTLF